MGRSISAGASGGQVTVSGSVATVNPNNFTPDPPVFLNKRHYQQSTFSRAKDWSIGDVEASLWPLTANDARYQCWFVENAPYKMWEPADTKFQLQFSLYSDFREVYADFLVNQDTPVNQSGPRWMFQPFHKADHNLQTVDYITTDNLSPYTIPFHRNSRLHNIDNLITFPDPEWKVYFRGRWVSKVDGSSGKFCEPLSISYNMPSTTINCGIAGDITFDHNFSHFLLNHRKQKFNVDQGFVDVGTSSEWGVDLDNTSGTPNIDPKILKPNTEYLISIGPNNSAYRTFFKATTSPSQNFFLENETSSVTDWPAGDYDIYIIGNGGRDPNYGAYGGKGGEIKKISQSFAAPFSASATNTNLSDAGVNTGETVLTINGSEAGRSQNGAGALGGQNTNQGASGSPGWYTWGGGDLWRTKTMGQGTDYASENTWYKHNVENNTSKTSKGLMGIGFGGGWGGTSVVHNHVMGFGGSGFGNIYLPEKQITWAVVFVHKP